MPLTLDSNEVVSETINTLEINSFAVDVEASQIHVAYDKGVMIDGTFNPKIRDLMLTISGQAFVDAITAFESKAEVSKYADLKAALYDQLVAHTGLTGTVV